MNGKPLPDEWKLKPVKDFENTKKVTIFDLFR